MLEWSGSTDKLDERTDCGVNSETVLGRVLLEYGSALYFSY